MSRLTIGTMKLYRCADFPDAWIGEDAEGSLVRWPAEPGGWLRRTPFWGKRSALEEAEPALARGTGWPGAGRAPKRRAASGQASSEQLTVRATPDEMTNWRKRATSDGKPPAVWARDELNAAVARPRGKSK